MMDVERDALVESAGMTDDERLFQHLTGFQDGAEVGVFQWHHRPRCPRSSLLRRTRGEERMHGLVDRRVRLKRVVLSGKPLLGYLVAVVFWGM